jgi:putative addiction module component (TIGR02574 family)
MDRDDAFGVSNWLSSDGDYMSLTRDQILSEALALDPTSRAELAESLWLSVDEATQAEIDTAWAARVRRRVEDLDAGRAGVKPVEESIERLRLKAAQ